MHSLNLDQFALRTDLIIDQKTTKNIHTRTYKYNDIEVKRTTSTDKLEHYVSISFKDITDKDIFHQTETIFIKELKKFLAPLKLREQDSLLVIGLGNDKITPDALGPLAIDNVLVTKYLFTLGEVEKGYQNVCTFKPSVTGSTGIDSIAMIKSIIKVSKAKGIIIIDALAASSIDRVNKTIQITDTGIHPGSGVYNNRGEVSQKTVKVPVIAIGIPTIVDANTIVVDTLAKLDTYFSKKNTSILGQLSNLSKEELKQLLDEIIPYEYTLMVTPKEIDLVMEKLALLLGNGINKTLHKNFYPTK